MSQETKPNDQSGGYIPFSERYPNLPVIRHLSRLNPEEQAAYFAVPGWRMWECSSPLAVGIPREYK